MFLATILPTGCLALATISASHQIFLHLLFIDDLSTNMK